MTGKNDSINEQKNSEKVSEDLAELSLILDTISDTIFITDDKGDFTFICPGVHGIFGYTVAEIKEFGNISYLLGNNIPGYHELEKKSEINNVSCEVVDRDGYKHSLLVNIKKISYNNRTILYICRDITEFKTIQRKLFFEKTKFVSILNTMNDGVCIVNQNYDIEYVNPAFERELGHVQDSKCYEYFYNRQSVCPWCKHKEVFLGKTVQWEYHCNKNNKTYSVIDGQIVNPDSTISKLQIFRDISERKRREEEIHFLSQQLINVEEKQRKIIARELHDECGQTIAVLRMGLECLKNDKSIDISKKCDPLIDLLDQLGDKIRNMSNSLRPDMLEHLGLIPTIQSLIDEVKQQITETVVTFNADGFKHNISGDCSLVVYRVIQEALNNIIKHAHATKVDILLTYSNDEISFSVEDNGQGFNKSDVFGSFNTGNRSKGIGLLGMRERIESIGGRVEIHSESGKGTIIKGVLPIKVGEEFCRK